jgi:hypothetical protein
MQVKSRKGKVQATIRVPKALYEQVRSCVLEGSTTAMTINDFIIRAIEAYTKMLRRKRIDAEFSHMAGDAAYQREAQFVAEEFASSDWEALEIAEEPLREETNAAR